MYITASIAIFTFFIIQAVRPLAIRPAGNGEPALTRSSRNHPIHPLDSTNYEAHNSENITPQDESQKRVSLRTNQNQGTSGDIYETHDPIVTIVAVSSTPPAASTETNVLLHPRKRDNTGGNSGCCSGDKFSVSVKANCTPPCFK